MRFFVAFLEVLLSRKFLIKHVMVEIIVRHVLLVLNIYGWDVQVLMWCIAAVPAVYPFYL
jgi:hypothetical protein